MEGDCNCGFLVENLVAWDNLLFSGKANLIVYKVIRKYQPHTPERLIASIKNVSLCMDILCEVKSFGNENFHCAVVPLKGRNKIFTDWLVSVVRLCLYRSLMVEKNGAVK